MSFKPENVITQPDVAAVIEGLEAAADARQDLEAVFGNYRIEQMGRIVSDAIKQITRSRAYFRERVLNQTTLKLCQRELPLELLEHERFEELMGWAIGQYPLVELGSTRHVTTVDMLEREKEVLHLAGAQTARHVLPESIVQKAIDSKKGISEEQTAAVHAACYNRRDVSVIEGTAGAGKSFTMQAVKEAYEACGYDVVGTALSHNAAKVLSGSIGLKKGLAIEGFIRSLRRARESGTEYFRKPTLIIVDEAGMVGTDHMHAILSEAQRSKHRVKVVLTGDSLQVNPVAAGNILDAIVEVHGTTRIDTIRRQKQESHRVAVRRFSKRLAGQGIYTLMQQECMHWCADDDDVMNMVVRDYLSYRVANATNPNKNILIIALRNKDVSELNRRIRSAYRKLGFIDAREVEVSVTDGRERWKSPFSVGDEVVLRSNDANLVTYYIDPESNPTDESQWKPKGVGVFNRNSGRIVGIRRAPQPVGSYDFIVDVGGDSPFRAIINSEKFRHPEASGLPMVHNFATTIYGSQGQTVQKVLLLDSPQMQFRLAYVGCSRHTENLEVYLNEADLHRRLDAAVGMSAPTEEVLAGASGQAVEAKVVTGRYTRAEMIQAVALNWSKDDQNMTATMFLRRSETGQLEKKAQDELAFVTRGSATDKIIDFIPELNEPVPLVDLEQIMNLPDPITETDIMRPSTVEANRQTAPNDRTPTRLSYEDVSIPAAAASTDAHHEGEGLFMRAAHWVRQHMGHNEPPKPAAPKSAAADTHDAQEAPGAFLTESAPRRRPPMAQKGLAGLLKAWGGRPKPIDNIPLREMPPSIGRVEGVDEEAVLRFEHVPQTQGDVRSPSDEFLKRARGLWWDRGRGNEPRILAFDHTGVVQARYRLDGKCMVGNAYPPMLLNHHATTESPIYIVPGAREWFLVAEHHREKYAQAPEKIPHVIWGARDVDWKPIVGSMKGKKVVILRSKTDEAQLPWAEGLQNILAGWGVDVDVQPRPPRAQASTTPSPQAAGAAVEPAPVAAASGPAPAIRVRRRQ